MNKELIYKLAEIANDVHFEYSGCPGRICTAISRLSEYTDDDDVIFYALECSMFGKEPDFYKNFNAEPSEFAWAPRPKNPRLEW